MHPSPFRALLDSNTTPSQTEARAIRDHCSGLSHELSALEIEIAQQISRRNELQSEINAHLRLISPFRTLSPEVLQIIFFFCLPDRNPVIHGSEAPLLLTRICRSWREIAIGTPMLWNKIHISIPPTGVGTSVTSRLLHQYCLRMTKTWLSRSGNLPLYISLSAIQPTIQPLPPQYLEPVKAIEQVVVELAHRWKRLELSFPPLFFQSLLQLTSQDVPMLSEVIWDRDQRDNDFWSPELTDPESELHFLEDVQLTTLHLHGDLYNSSLSFRSDKLQHLNLSFTEFGLRPSNISGGSHTSWILDLLGRCPLLESIRLYIPCDVSFLDPEPERALIPLLNLRSLKIYAPFEPVPMHIFNGILSPNLEHLTVGSVRGIRFNPLEWYFYVPIKQFLSKSSPTVALKDLAIDVNHSELVSELLKLIQDCPSLTSLAISSQLEDEMDSQSNETSTTWDKVFRALRIDRHTTSSVLPYLKKFSIRGVLPQSLTESSQLRECIRSRVAHTSEGVAHLSNLHISYEQPLLSFDVHEAFQDLRVLEEQGLKVAIEAPYLEDDCRKYSPFYKVPSC